MAVTDSPGFYALETVALGGVACFGAQAGVTRVAAGGVHCLRRCDHLFWRRLADGLVEETSRSAASRTL